MARNVLTNILSQLATGTQFYNLSPSRQQAMEKDTYLHL